MVEVSNGHITRNLMKDIECQRLGKLNTSLMFCVRLDIIYSVSNALTNDGIFFSL